MADFAKTEPSEVPVTPPTTRHLFSLTPNIHEGKDGTLVLSRSIKNRLLLMIGVMGASATAVLSIYEGLNTGEWGSLLLLLVFLLVMWSVWSVVSVTFDRNQGRMRLRRSLYPLRPTRDRSCKDLRAVLVVKFGSTIRHVRLIFDSEPRVVEVSGFWNQARAKAFAAKLSELLGVPLVERTYQPKLGNKV